jgi:hypothetical protein
MLDRRAERAAHAAGGTPNDGPTDGQAVERCPCGLVLAAEHDEDVVEACGADLSDRAADERLAAKRQQELLCPHPRRGACRENHTAHHRNSVEKSVGVDVVESLF